MTVSVSAGAAQGPSAGEDSADKGKVTFTAAV